MTALPALGVRKQPQSPAHITTRTHRAAGMASWGIVACVVAFVLCEIALVIA